MATQLFTDRNKPRLPRTAEEIPLAVKGALVQIVQSRIDDNSFGLSFPETCPDGPVNAGVNQEALRQHMEGFRVVWPGSVRGTLETFTLDELFDLLEYSFQHLAQPVEVTYHGFFRHYHYTYDQNAGRRSFSEAVNDLFERNGLVYELRDGRVERIAPGVLRQVLPLGVITTGDETLDRLLSEARDRFLDRDLRVRREALERLWDAWERMKSAHDPNNKANSVKLMLDRAATEENFRQKLELEARQLTDIGNSFLIRHAEVNRPEIGEASHVDYLFHRLFAMIRLVLKMHGVAI